MLPITLLAIPTQIALAAANLLCSAQKQSTRFTISPETGLSSTEHAGSAIPSLLRQRTVRDGGTLSHRAMDHIQSMLEFDGLSSSVGTQFAWRASRILSYDAERMSSKAKHAVRDARRAGNSSLYLVFKVADGQLTELSSQVRPETSQQLFAITSKDSQLEHLAGPSGPRRNVSRTSKPCGECSDSKSKSQTSMQFHSPLPEHTVLPTIAPPAPSINYTGPYIDGLGAQLHGQFSSETYVHQEFQNVTMTPGESLHTYVDGLHSGAGEPSQVGTPWFPEFSYNPPPGQPTMYAMDFQPTAQYQQNNGNCYGYW
ncbi:hypothetical protein A7U60_g8115 [Sanghuangporus baumii]|uniref:Uncharacterized protein n=1 Tax=Sanghuangporus baumii TaxID=108892 RepID=A0A9Q5HRX8_SANBA|nr:hypothetical protein A7U60_g8115 [Sanghuangporus baumii]